MATARPPPSPPLLLPLVLLMAALLDGCSALKAHVPMAPDNSCPEGSKDICRRLPGEAQYCLQEVFICDKTRHCKHGEDENMDLCDRRKIATTILKDDAYGNSNDTDEEPDDCSLTNFNESVCECVYGTRLGCNHKNLTRIPNVSHNITHMYLQGNQIVLRKGDIDLYKKLYMLNLNGNGIKTIPPGFFVNQGDIFKLLLHSNQLTGLPDDAFGGDSPLVRLHLDRNQLTEVPRIGNLTKLLVLYLSYNKITLEGYGFPPCALQDLHLEGNLIWSVTNRTIRNLVHLKTLFLNGNQIKVIARDAFHGLTDLNELYLGGNQLTVLDRSWFRDMSLLTVLDIGNNGFTAFPEDGFHDLKSMFTLLLTGLKIGNISKSMWTPLRSLSVIQFSRFSDCNYVPRVKICEPRTDGVSSMEHLLDTTAHRAMIWVIALLTVTGNLVVLWGRGFQRADDNKNVSVLICNLAVADLLMGIYLFVLAFKDVEYRGDYNMHALHWRFSPLCVISGVLAMTSSEVAVMIMTFMSVDRFLAIVYPMVRQRASSHMSRTVLCCMTFIWACGLTIALIPVFYWETSYTFYSINSICFPLHIKRHNFVGWQYSAFIFLGVNVFSLVVIISSYAAMFFNIRQTRRNTPLVVREVEVAFRFFCIVATDCLCWTPIIIIKILVLFGVDISTELHASIVVFVMPINSAVNPFLYTFTTTKFYSRIKTATTKYSSCLPRGPRRESVNHTGSESVAFTQRTSLQTLPAAGAGERNGQPTPPSEPLLTSRAATGEHKC